MHSINLICFLTLVITVEISSVDRRKQRYITNKVTSELPKVSRRTKAKSTYTWRVLLVVRRTIGLSNNWLVSLLVGRFQWSSSERRRTWRTNSLDCMSRCGKENDAWMKLGFLCSFRLPLHRLQLPSLISSSSSSSSLSLSALLTYLLKRTKYRRVVGK